MKYQVIRTNDIYVLKSGQPETHQDWEYDKELAQVTSMTSLSAVLKLMNIHPSNVWYLSI